MKILITGASGFIGRACVRAFLDAGHQVIALSHSPSPALPPLPSPEGSRPHSRSPSPSGSYWALPWDPAAGIHPTHLPHLEGVDAVIHLAGEPLAAHRWTPSQKERIRSSRVEGTRQLVAALEKLHQRPAVLVSASAIGIYGDGGDTVLTESSPPGEGFLPQVCQAWEREARRAESLGIRTVQLRLGMVLGPGGALARLLMSFRLGLGGRLGSGQQWVSWIHRTDAVRLIMQAVSSSQYRGPFNATSPNPVRNREFTSTLGRVLGRPAVLPVPASALKLAFGEMSSVLLESQRVMPEAALKAGFRFTHPHLEDALRAAVQEFSRA